MSRGDIKPWSQLDDEHEEPGFAPSGPEGDPSAAAEGRPELSSRSRPSSSERRFSTKLAVHWALAPLGAAAVWALWLVIRSLSDGGAAGHMIGILAMILLAGAILVSVLRAQRAALADLRDAIVLSTKCLPAGLGPLPKSAEFRPVYEAMEQHARNIEHRTAELLDEHKRISLELGLAEANKRQAEAIIDSIPEPILAVDPYDQVLLANPAAESLFQFSRDKSLRKPLAEVVHDAGFVDAVRQTREADARVANRVVEQEIGSQVYAVRLAPLTTEARGGEPAGEHGAIALLRNITKEREASRNKSEFVAHAAHELRTPLSSIRAYVEMLLDGEAGDEKTLKEYYNIIDSSAERLGRMIDNILNISRIEAGTVRINKEPVAISVIVKEAIDVARPQAEEKSITLTEELTPVVYRVNADRDLINQAILNLLSNAIKYTPSNGKVHVRMVSQEEDRIIRIEVSDTGVGIPKSDLPRMFEKFFRVEVNNKMAKGTGLGLNLVRHIVETIHEGKVTLVSEEGKGSTFGMNLPLLA